MPKILAAIVHPYDFENDRIMMSNSGKYVLRLRFNGCWRKVEIDDYLPTSKTDRILHVVDRNNPGLFWPALVEKAYLKVRGGYEFPGSNSATDLAVITGWIPQQIFLHDEDVEFELLWERIYQGFVKGDLLLTIGTGKLPEREQRVLGLAAEHDYAVLEMREQGDTKEMLVKNPWADGDVWRGTMRRRSNSSPALTSSSDQPTENNISDESMLMSPGTFWVDFASVFHHFENFYVNWNPGIFSKREDIHFSWSLDKVDRSPGLFVGNPQFTITTPVGGNIWLLLNKHFRTGDYTASKSSQKEYISLYIYDNKGNRVISSDSAKIRGPYVDSPNTLLTLDAPAETCYTVVVASQHLLSEKYSFTLSAFSNASFMLQEAQSQYAHEDVVTASWTRANSGGNSDSPYYLTNPQFSLCLRVDADIALILRLADLDTGGDNDSYIKVLVNSSDGRRVTRLRPRDIVAHSGDYRRGSAVVESRLHRGNYTIICSTFDPGQYRKFTLTVCASATEPPLLKLLPAENSGKLSSLSEPARFSPDINRLLAPVTFSRHTKALFIARTGRTEETLQTTASLFKMSLEQGQGPYKTILSSSALPDAEYTSLKTGVRIDEMNLQPRLHNPGAGGFWLVLERLFQPSSIQTGEDSLRVEALADERLELGPWGYGDG